MSKGRVSAFLSTVPLPRPRSFRSSLSPAHAPLRLNPSAQTPPPPPFPPSSSSDPPRVNNRLEELNAIPNPPPPPSYRREQTDSFLGAAGSYLSGQLARDVDDFLSSPYRLLLAAAVSILFGFFAATSASTIIGSVADWDPLAAAVLLIWTESYTKFYYRAKQRGKVLQLINAFKIGLIYGMTLDAFKLST